MQYHKIFAEFPNITTPIDVKKTPQHNTMHYIQTTTGPPEACKSRRLAPDKLKAAKAEFELLLQEGIIQPSKNPWSSPLHLNA